MYKILLLGPKLGMAICTIPYEARWSSVRLNVRNRVAELLSNSKWLVSGLYSDSYPDGRVV